MNLKCRVFVGYTIKQEQMEIVMNLNEVSRKFKSIGLDSGVYSKNIWFDYWCITHQGCVDR